MNEQNTPDPGWYPDPAGSGRLRWWDGGQWTEQFSGGSSEPPTVANQEGSTRTGPRSGKFFIIGGVAAALLLVVGAVAAFLLINETQGGADYRVAVATPDSGPIVTSELDGSDTREINFSNQSTPWEMFATRDGRFLVFGTGGEGGISDIHVLPTSGQGEARDLEGNTFQLASASDEVFFNRYNEATEGSDVFRLGIEGGDPEKVAEGYLESVSDDGSALLVSTYDDDLEESTYTLLDPDTGQSEEIDLGYEEYILDVSPDGTRIFTYVDEGYEDYDPEGYIHNLETGESESLGTIGTGEFSPDGKRLFAGDDSYDTTIWNVIDMESGESVTIGEGSSLEAVPGSDDVILTRDEGGDTYTEYHQYLVDVETGEEEEIARGESISVAPDGESIAFIKYEGTGDNSTAVAYTANLDGTSVTKIGEGFTPVFYEVP